VETRAHPGCRSCRPATVRSVDTLTGPYPPTRFSVHRMRPAIAFRPQMTDHIHWTARVPNLFALGVVYLTTDAMPSRVVPTSSNNIPYVGFCSSPPHRPTAPLTQPGLVGWPVGDLALLAWNVVAAILVQLERHGGYSELKRREALLRQANPFATGGSVHHAGAISCHLAFSQISSTTSNGERFLAKIGTRRCPERAGG
jgi:hypothetical protein